MNQATVAPERSPLRRLRPSLALAFMASGAWYVVLVCFAAVGLRGSDQYWYVSDTSMATEFGLRATNTVYPAYSMLGSSPHPTSLPSPIHNVPIGYLAEVLSRAGLSAYLSWVVANTALALLVALALYGCSRLLELGSLALLPSLLVVSFPLTLWQSVNALADMSLMFGAALLLLGSLGFERRGEGGYLWLAALGAVLLFWTRDDYIVILLAFVGYCIWSLRRKRLGATSLLLVTGVSVIASLLKPMLFPKHPGTGLLGSINSRVTMDFYFAKPSASVSALLQNWATGFIDSVLPNSPVEVVTELPVIVAAIAGLWVTRKTPSLLVLRYWVICFLITYVAASTLFQSQNRYILPLVPSVSLLAVSGLAVTRSAWNQKVRSPLIAMVIVGSLSATSGLMAWQYRHSATSESAMVTSLEHSIGTATSGPILAIGTTTQVLPVAYALLPRPVLVVDPDKNGPEATGQLLARWKVAYVLGSPANEPFLKAVATQLGSQLHERTTAQTPGGEVTVWSIQ